MTTKFRVDHIHCGGCAKKIEAAIQQVQADARVKVDVEGGIVEVEEIVDRAAVEKAIEGAGYSLLGAA